MSFGTVVLSISGKSIMHQVVVTVLCRLPPPPPPPFPQGNLPFSGAGKPSLLVWEVLLSLQNLRHKFHVFPRQDIGPNNRVMPDAKRWPRDWCMFDSLGQFSGR